MITDKPLDNVSSYFEQFKTVRYKSGKIIYLSNSEPTCAYAIKSGFIRSFIYIDNNEERSISFVLKNELFPITWLFSNSQTALFNYVAHTDCELYMIDPNVFHGTIMQHVEVSQQLLINTMKDSVTKMLEIQALEQLTAERKILYMLNYFSFSYGNQTLRNSVQISVPLTHKDIASFTGLARETVTIVVLSLKRKGIISVRKRFYSINMDLLREALERTGDTAPTLG